MTDKTAPTAAALRSDRRRFRAVRWIVLLAILAISTTIGLLHQKAPGLGLVGVDALCPFGGVESFWALVTSGGLVIRRIAMGSFVLLGVSVLLAFTLGRSFCGQFCPLGTLQELFGSLRTRLGFERQELPASVDAPARYLKYAVLFVFTWLAWRLAELVIRPYDPWVAYHHLTSPELLTEFGIGALVLGITVVGSFLYDRFFCKYACPMGAFLGLLSRFSWMKVRRDERTCITCGRCDQACPVNLDVMSSATPDPSECLSCGICIAECPVPGALEFKPKNGPGRLKPIGITLVTLAVMLGVVGVATASGEMSFTKVTLAEQLKGEGLGELPGGGGEHGDAGGAGQGAGTGAGQWEPGQPFDPGLIRGQTTMVEISEASGIPLPELLAEFGMPESAAETVLKEAKVTYGFDMEQVRAYVAERMAAQ